MTISSIPKNGGPSGPALTTNRDDIDRVIKRLDAAEADALQSVATVELDTDRLCERGGPDPRLVNVGAQPSRARLTTALLELARDELRLEPEITRELAVRQARARLEQMLRERLDRTAGTRALTAPTREAPRRDGEHDEVMITAALDADPGLRYALRDLTGPDEVKRRGPDGARERPLATVFTIGMGMLRPNFEDAYLLFQKVPILRHAFNDPAGPSTSSALRQMHQVLERKDSTYLQHLLVDQFKRICELRDDRGELKYPNAGTVVLADATLMEADIEQRAPRDEADAKAMRGERFKDTGWIVYTSDRSALQDPTAPRSGMVTTKCHGWKMMALVDQDTGAVMMAEKFPADVNERAAALMMIKRYFDLWPDCPRFRYLVGDSLYDNRVDFAFELWFDWSIHPVFPTHGKYAKTLPYVEDNPDKLGIQGVPCCPFHTRDANGDLRPMKFKDDSNLITVEKRQKLGIPRGKRVEDQTARNRWVCWVEGCEETATTWFREDARVYTHLHRAGTHKRKELRDSLLARRNRVESCFSALKNSGLGAPGTSRARWAGDIEMRWLILIATCGYNARILAQDTGAYDRALKEAISLGLIVTDDADTTFATRQAVTADRRQHIELSRAPRSWKHRTLDRLPDEIAELEFAA